ncbi:MAG: FAD-dependent oxidoreductase [Gemmatimonadota bacterium]
MIGGGIQGATIAWDATLRGLRVALIDKGDFGGETSANSLKIIHGGFRYLRSGDLRRMRESIRERSILLAIAPGQLRPLPVVVPISAVGGPGRTALQAALVANEFISAGRNRRLSEAQKIPRGRMISSSEARNLCPALEGVDIDGGAVWYDAQAVQPERLTLAFIRSAAAQGAVVANRVIATDLMSYHGRTHGVIARDEMTGESLEIAARVTLNATGPWSGEFLRPKRGGGPRTARLALAVNLVTSFPPMQAALAVRSPTPASGDPVGGGHRYLFLAPWRASTLIGTAYRQLEPGAEPSVAESDLMGLLTEANAASRGLRLTAEDVTFHHAGRVPLRAGREAGRPMALAERALLTDHGLVDGRAGLVSVNGVKFTTARSVASAAVDLVFNSMGITPPSCRTADTALMDEPADPAETLASTALRAIRSEMAHTCADVIFRRSGLGTERAPLPLELSELATTMGEELGWSEARRAREVLEVEQRYLHAARS